MATPLVAWEGCLMQVNGLPNGMTNGETVVHTRLLLKQAARYLTATYAFSLREAEEWIQQEARAKRGGLREVAEAIVAQRTVGYHYNAPV
jgi:AmiR/NasT family two-component response regulator